jgi:hypothetical protein
MLAQLFNKLPGSSETQKFIAVKIVDFWGVPVLILLIKVETFRKKIL